MQLQITQMTLTKLKYFIIISLLPFTIYAAKSSTNYNNQIQKRSHHSSPSTIINDSSHQDYPSISDAATSSASSSSSSSPSPSSTSTSGCSSCSSKREEIKIRNLYLLKQEILKRMGFATAPNVTGRILPKVPQHYISKIEEEHGMINDQPYRSDGTTNLIDEDDEYHVRTQSFLIFAEYYPHIRHSNNKLNSEILHCTFTESITKFHVANATLNFLVEMNESPGIPRQLIIEIYKVIKPGDRNSPPKLRLVYNRIDHYYFGGEKWIQLDLTETVGEWFKNSRENFGFYINATVNGKKVLINDIKTDKKKVPFVDVSVKEPKRRKRRNSGLNCDEKSNESICCRYNFVIDFVEIGFDFIVAPKRYDAHICSGECPLVTLQRYPYTHLIKMQEPNLPAPCCTARKMSAISMLYFDDSLNVVMGSVPGMVVERCGCS